MARNATKTAKKTPAKAEAKSTRARKAGNPNAIVTNIGDRSGAHVICTSAGGATVTFPRNRETPELRAASNVGQDIRQLSKLVAALPPKEAHVARGVDSKNSPQTMATVRSQREATKAASKASAPAKAPKADKAAAKAARKAARAEKAAPKADDTRKITIVDKKFTFGGEGTARRACWDAVKSGSTVADYVKAGGKVKYLPRWVSAGAIKLA